MAHVPGHGSTIRFIAPGYPFPFASRSTGLAVRGLSGDRFTVACSALETVSNLPFGAGSSRLIRVQDVADRRIEPFSNSESSEGSHRIWRAIVDICRVR